MKGNRVLKEGEMNVRKWDWSISFVRMIAMSFIIICHFLQYYGNELAWWFNVGVQMFLFISGLLFANRNVDILVLKKQFVKILVPYYLFTIMANLIWVVFSSDANITDIVSIMLLHSYGKFQGLQHLWFISYILLAYVMTPLFISILRVFEKTFFSMMCSGFLIIIGLLIFFELFAAYYNAAWMICYFLGIIMGRLLNREDPKMIQGRKYIIFIIVILSVVFNSVQIIIDYYICPNFFGVYESIYNKFCNYAHVLLGITLVLLLRYIYNKVTNSSGEHYILRWSDKYSYYIYLVHQLFILGCFSLCTVIDTPVIAVPVSMCVIVLVGIILNKLTEKILTKTGYRKRN